MEPISIIFSSINFAKSIAEFTGIVESLDKKIDKLSKSEFYAGMNSLKQSVYSESERVYLLREARSFFNKAISLEKDENLVLAYVGLAACHYHLNDIENSRKALMDALNVIESVKATIKVGEVMEYLIRPKMIDFIFTGRNVPSISEALNLKKKERMDNLKNGIETYLEYNNLS